jgi:hypothetical protein
MPGTKQRAKPIITHTLHDLEAARVLEIRSETARAVRSDFYLLDLSRSDFGRAFRLTRLGSDGTAYDVCLEADGATHCGCRGHEAHGHCKHVTALASLVAAGKL